jgi:hypothetical protein
MKKLILLLIMGLSLQCAFAQTECKEPGAITGIKYEKKDSAAQLIFSFVAPAATFKIEKTKPPFIMDPSDDEKVNVKGQQFYQITFMSVGWVCTIPVNLKGIGKGPIMDFKNAGQFEGYFTYIIGVKKGVKATLKTLPKKGKVQQVVVTCK